MHEYLMTDRTWLRGPVNWDSVASLHGTGEQVTISACLHSPSTDARLSEDLALAGELRITATPTFVGKNAIHSGALTQSTLTALR